MNDRRPPDSALMATASLSGLEALERLEVPLIVLIGGATGTGKSTVATQVAHRLGITRVTSTDVVRQTMRAFFSSEFMPSIHHSSFEAPEREEAEDPESDPVLAAFLDQTRNVLVGVRAVLARALEEGYSLALEGVHLVPGLIPPVDGAVFCQVLLMIDDEDEHASHFWTRGGEGGLRPFDKYLRALPDIRRVQDYLVARAAKNRVPVIENASIDATVDHVIDLVLGEVERVRTPA